MKLFKLIHLFILSLSVIPGIVDAQNIALNKSYILSETPNYAYSAAPTDKTSLTDGIYTKEAFWRKPTTVGWTSKQVTITIDLGEIMPIGSIALNTFRNIKVGISFPQNIFVFTSINNKDLRFVGDAADSPLNIDGPSEVKKFVLNSINQNARYVTLTLVPKGMFLFCDEIEVLKGKANNAIIKKLIIKEYLKHAVDSLITLDYNRKNLTHLIDNLQNYSRERTGKNNNYFSDFTEQLKNKDISENDLKNIKNAVGKEHAKNLKSDYRVSYVLEKNNPWDSISELHDPKLNSSILNYQFVIPKDGVQYGSFVITNINTSTQPFSFNISNANNSVCNIEIFHIPFVQSSNYDRLPDPLVKVKNAIDISSGISEMFLFKITGVNKGSTKSIITIHSHDMDKKVSIDSQVRNLFGQNNEENLNVNVWAYLYYPMLKDRQAEAVKDLELHHINTIVIPPLILPDMVTSDFKPFTAYLNNFKSAKNILLYLNYTSIASRNGYKNGQFMTSEWKNNFILWYTNMVNLIRDNGFPNSNIYLYPYDEVRGNNIEEFKNLVIWAKKTLTGIKFYATLDNRVAIDTILPLIDIAQIHFPNNGLNELPSHQCEIWMYKTVSSARSLSPYLYYRLMAWEAFVNDYNGIGFWNYAVEGNDRQLNLISDPLIDFNNNYSAIYDGSENEIISSRRWEAFRLGIEDYSILKLCAKKIGSNKVKILVKQVLDNPRDLNKADSTRMEMINMLIGE